MEKSFEMDYEGWEVVPDMNHHHHNHSLLDFSFDNGKSLMFCDDIDIDYFSEDKNSSSIICSTNKKEELDDEELNLKFKGVGVVVQELPDYRNSPPPPLVMFKKMNDDDMKVESPRSNIPTKSIEPVMFDCRKEEEEEEYYEDEKNSEKQSEFEEGVVGGKQGNGCWEEGLGVKIWNWRVVGGVGALCSLGVAAATICIFILGGRQQQKKQQFQNQKIQLQICGDEKRIKQVMQQATRLNQAFSAARGIPVTRAHISFGGYYDGL